MEDYDQWVALQISIIRQRTIENLNKQERRRIRKTRLEIAEREKKGNSLSSRVQLDQVWLPV